MLQLLRLTFLRPVEGFLARCIAISSEPGAFVQERIHLGDTTNFLRAAGFFVSAISSAFLAEVATLYLLGIGDLTQLYYWLFILLTLMLPVVLICFIFVRLVAPLSLKDVLHLSFYPIGAGVFVGAALALVASAVIASLAAVGFIPEIKYDFTQWGTFEEGPALAIHMRALHDCLKAQSLTYTILASGLQLPYNDLKPPLDELSDIRPVITVLYLLIAARIFMAAVKRQKWAVFAMVCLAAVVATGATVASLREYFAWNSQHSDCGEKQIGEIAMSRYGDSVLKVMAAKVQAYALKNNFLWDVSAKAEGRTLAYTYRFKRPWPDVGAFYRWLSGYQRTVLENHCSNDEFLER